MLKRCPKKHEIQNCTHILLGNTNYWDPYNNNFSKCSSMQLFDNISSINNNVSSPQKYDSEFDIMMSSISTSLSPNTLSNDVGSILF